MEHMLDKDVERVLFSEEELHRRVAEIAAEIDRDYAGREPLLVSVLRVVNVLLIPALETSTAAVICVGPDSRTRLPVHPGINSG